MANNLNSKLTRVDEAIATMRQNLKISSNAPVEEVVNATNFALKDLMNIYIQENEPAEKDGIWLKTQPFDYDSVTIDEKCHIKGTLDGELGTHENYGYNNGPGVVCDQNYAYTIVDKKVLRYDIKNNWEKEQIATTVYPSAAAIGLNNNILYIAYERRTPVEALDLSTLIFSTAFEMPSQSTSYSIGCVDEYVIVFGSSDGVSYNTITKQSITLSYPRSTAHLTSSIDNCCAPTWGGCVVSPMMGGSQYIFDGQWLYDPRQNVFTYLEGTKGWSYLYSETVIGNDLYYLQRDKIIRKYNFLTKQSEVFLDLSATYDLTYATLFNYNEQMFIFSGLYCGNNIWSIASDSSVYPDNTIVILQGLYKQSVRTTCLFSLPETNIGKLQWPFNDIFPYINGEFMINIPTYYGNGTEWIKYKN